MEIFSILETRVNLTSEELEGVAVLQRQDPQFKEIIQYKETQLLPQDTEKARRVVAESDMYEIVNDVLFRTTVSGLIRNRQTQWRLAVPQQLQPYPSWTLGSEKDLCRDTFGTECT